MPDIAGPDISSGTIPLPNSYAMRTPADDVSRGRIQSWNLAVEKRIRYDLSVDVAYVGTHGSGGFADLDVNASTTPGCGADCQPFFTKFGRSNSLNLWGPRTKSNYHSLQVAINRPFKNGFLLKGAYTLSKAKNETDDDGWARARTATHRASSIATTRSPATTGRTSCRWRSSTSCRTRRARARMWRTSSSATGRSTACSVPYSGTPFTITADGAELNMPGTRTDGKPEWLLRRARQARPAGTYFDTSAFSQPQGVVFGNTGRNQFRGPGAWNLDFSLFRAFPIGRADRSRSSSAWRSSTC